jgi:hypothetical protein
MEIIANLCDIIKVAIDSGDWIVDGACDPVYDLDIAEAKLEQEGWHRNPIDGIWCKNG